MTCPAGSSIDKAPSCSQINSSALASMRRSSNSHGTRSLKDFERAGLMAPIPLGHNAPISFRMAREEDLQLTAADDPRQGADSTFGVQSLPDAVPEPYILQKDTDLDDGDGDGNNSGSRRRSTLRPLSQSHDRDSSQESSREVIPNTSSPSPSRPSHGDTLLPQMSHSVTSLSLDSQGPLSSLPSTPKSISNRSFRPSDEESMDDGGSQAVVSSEDEDVEAPPEIHDSAPQLIMPSIKMPSRRPFTERGKAMGRLKVLIAGDSGRPRGDCRAHQELVY